MRKLTEGVILRHRSLKYKYKNDTGGIAYIHSAVKKGQTVFDIGAHKAGYLYYLRKLTGPGGRVIALEPQSYLFGYIRRLKDLFNWDNVSVEHLALSDQQGTATLYIPGKNPGKTSSPSASIVEQRDHSGCLKTEQVETETLDSLCAREKLAPAFLKIDVEGNELKVLKGGINTLRKHKPGVLVEIEARHVGQKKVLETFEFMKSLGYTGHFIHGKRRVPLSAFSFDTHQNLKDKNNYCNNFTFE